VLQIETKPAIVHGTTRWRWRITSLANLPSLVTRVSAVQLFIYQSVVCYQEKIFIKTVVIMHV